MLFAPWLLGKTAIGVFQRFRASTECWKSRRVGLMCTLSVITRNDEYLLAMNRDEKIARGAGVPPEIHHRNGTTAMYPSDGAGGTWIATNEYGITLALLNWNDVAFLPWTTTRLEAEGKSFLASQVRLRWRGCKQRSVL